MAGQFESILDKLQAKLGKQTIRKASTIARPKPRPDVVQIQLINDFMKRNPIEKMEGGRIGFANGGDGDYIYTRPSGAKRLIIGNTIYGSVAKGDKKALEALKKKRDKLVKTLNVRAKYDLEALKKEWRKTLPTKKATTWENFLKTKFPEG